MKNNKKIIMSIVLGLVIILTIIGIFLSTNNNDNNKNNDKDKEPTKKVVQDTDGTILYEFEDEKLIDIVDYMNSVDYVTFRKMIIEKEYLEDGTIKNTEYLQWIVADVNTMDNIDVTVDILSTPEGGEPIIDGQRPDFKETFGFDHTQYDDVFSIVMKMAKTQGIGTNLEDYELSELLLQSVGQETYVLNNKELPIIQEILSTIEFDEIINTTCRYTVVESDNKDGFLINNITASVKYKINGETKAKTISFAIGIHSEPIEDPLE